MTYAWMDEPGAKPSGANALVLSSFPSVGLAATVAAHYMVQTLKLPRTGIFSSAEVPSIAVVQGGRVNPAVRVYGRSGLTLVLSEFPPMSSSVHALAEAILDGAEARGARAIVGLEGVMPHPAVDENLELAEEQVWAVGSRSEDGLVARLAAAGARPLEDGVLGGVSGALLVAGLSRKIPVAVLLVSAQANEGYPDHRAGAALIEVLDRFLPEIAIDTKPLRTQAELIEKALRAAMKSQTRAERPVPDPHEPTIYQ